MLKKTIIVLTVLLVGLLAVSAVSAADNATSDIAGADDSADQVDSAIEEENFDSSNASEGDDPESYSPMAIDDEGGKLGMSNDGEILGSEIHVRGDEFARIHVAIRQANDGDIIYLEGITYTSTGSSIIISKSITLVGQEGTVLDAQGKSGIFVVQADNVVIKNIKFINAKYAKGSAIDIGGDSNFSLSNCTFINNTAEVGGAIYWPAADGSITNCTFIGNSADYGGAMYTGGDGGEISNCVFINNNANYGKALEARSYSKIYDSYFKNIPFLDITDEDSSLTLTLMTNLDYSGTVSSSSIKKENLKYWNGSAYVNGDDPNFGTLQCPDKNVTLELYHSNGELAYRVSNFTDANGQIVFDYSKFNDDRYVYRAYAFDDDSNFISATGRLNGNIGDFTLLQNYINNVGENGTVNLTCDYTFTDGLDDNLKEGISIPFNLTIYGNGHTIDGAKSARIFNITGNNVAIHGIKFINGEGGDGGAIYVNGGCTLIDCIFTNNHALNDGGAVYWNTNAVGITNCTFENNHAENAGGANFFLNRVDNVILTGNFTNNTASMNGGANYFNDAVNNVTLTCNFINNRAETKNGGANFFNDEVTNVTLTGNFTNNRAKSSGGANNFWDIVDNVILTGNFTNNRAKSSGGANHFNGAVDNIALTGNFTNNRAETGSGGANFFNDEVTNVALTGNFTNNTAYGHSGANFFWAAVTNVTLTGNFTNNFAENGFGGVNNFNDEVINVTLTGNFTNNFAGIDGGVNNFAGAVTNVALTGNFINNRAETGSGGANYFYLTVTNVNLTGNFTNNTAQAYGGANYFKATVNNVTLTGNFTNNTAQAGGANAFSRANNVTLTGNFTNNRAETGDGGANCFYDEVTNITLSGNFINNTAGDGSGGVNNFNNIVTNISLSGNFTDNFALYDGGANCFYGDVTTGYFSGNFINNRAGRDGGANEFSRYIFDVTLSGNFINNTAGRNGGANEFYWDVTNVNLTGVFINNTAEKGSAHYFDYDLTNVIIAGNFINNNESSVIYIANSVSGNVIRDSIFINNAPITVYKGNITVIDNWFGNNVTDYNVKPEVGIDLDNWLFLNGTADPNPVSVADTSNIIFTLSRYDGNNVSSYDNSRLIPIKLDITSTLGSVNPNLVNLNESITYTPESVGNGSITASFENVLCTIEMEILKVEPDMSIDSYPSYGGENATITITLPQDAAGNVTVTDADGNNYTQPVKDGAVDIEVPNLNVGLNKLNITYSGDDEKYLPKTVEYEVQVDKMPTHLLAENIEMYQGDGTQYIVTLIDARERPVVGMGIKVNITGKTYTIITDENGTAVLPINLKAGIHPAVAFFNGKGNYANATPVSTNVSIMTKVRIDQHKDMTKDYGDADKFTVHAVDKYGKSVGAYAKVMMTVAGKTYTVFTDENGYASLAINLKPGTYDITCEYAGYKVTHKITVKQVLSATNRQYKKATSYQFTATLKHSNGKAISGKTVPFTFKGKTYTATTNSKGEATITIKEALNIGKYNIAIKYLDSTITKTITIK